MGNKPRNGRKKQVRFTPMAIIIAVVVVVAVLTVFFVLQGVKTETITIGAVLSFTGPGKVAGGPVRNGMLLAVDEINSWGGINGKKIKLIIEDSETNPQEGKEAFNRIEATYHPLLYVSTLSSVSLALAPLAEENEVVLVGLATVASALTKQKAWVYRYWVTAEAEVQSILPILRDLKVKKLGILYLNDEYGTSVFKLLKQEFERTGGTVRGEAFELKESYFKEQTAQLKAMEAICAVGYSSQVGKALKRLREEKFTGFILGPSGIVRPSIIAMPEANGLYVPAPIIYNPNFLFAKEVKEKYEDKYGMPFNHIAASGYDFLKLLAGLLEDKEVSRHSVKTLLDEGFIYPGVFGDLTVKPGQHDITFPLHPARIVDGEVKFLR